MHWPISSNYSFSHKAYEVKSIWTDPMIHLDVIKVKFSPNDTLNLHEIKTELEGISVSELVCSVPLLGRCLNILHFIRRAANVSLKGHFCKIPQGRFMMHICSIFPAHHVADAPEQLTNLRKIHPRSGLLKKMNCALFRLMHVQKSDVNTAKMLVFFLDQ